MFYPIGRLGDHCLPHRLARCQRLLANKNDQLKRLVVIYFLFVNQFGFSPTGILAVLALLSRSPRARRGSRPGRKDPREYLSYMR